MENNNSRLRYFSRRKIAQHECLYEDENKSIHPFADPFRLCLAIKYESRRYDNRWGFKWDKGKLVER